MMGIAIVLAHEFEAHFMHGTRLASIACRDLRNTRKLYKTKMRESDVALSRHLYLAVQTKLIPHAHDGIRANGAGGCDAGGEMRGRPRERERGNTRRCKQKCKNGIPRKSGTKERGG